MTIPLDGVLLMNIFLALQAHWRGYNAFSYYRKLQCAAISFQCAMRSHIARRELKLLQRVCVYLLLFSFFVLGLLQHVLLYTALPWESQKLKMVNCSLCYFILPHFEAIFFSLHNQMFYSNKITCLWRLQRKLELFKKLRRNWRNNVRSSHGACNLKSACGYI